MNPVAIVYATMTKHSQKIAAAIGQALSLPALKVKESPQVEAELLFIVGGIYGNESKAELLNFVGGMASQQVKKVALVTSSASMKRGQESVRKLLVQKGIQVIDELMLPGSFVFLRWGRPNRQDIATAVKFARDKAAGME